MATQLPNNDSDLLLAKRIGRVLEKGDTLSTLDDPLIEELEAYARSHRQDLDDQAIRSELLWSNIESEIDRTSDKSEKKSTPVTTLFNTAAVRWVAAAAVLIAAFIGFVYFQYLQGPTLVAESAQSIETVQLPDGSSVTLRPHTQLYELSTTEEGTMYSISGEAYFEVKFIPDRRFIVEAGNGRISVLGTKFTVSSWGNRIQVFLEEGRVRFEGPSREKSIVMEPGQSSVLDEGSDQPELIEADTQEFTDWLKNELVFQDKPARIVFSEIEQHFNITINAPNHIKYTSLSGEIALEDRQSTLNDLALVLGGTFERTGERTFTFVPN